MRSTGRQTVRDSRALESDLPTGVADSCELVEAAAWTDVVQAVSEQPGNTLGAHLGHAGVVPLPMVSALDYGPFNRVVGLGTGQAATEGQVDEIIHVYDGAGLSRYVISLSPLARPTELPDWFSARRFARGATVAKLWRDLAPPLEPTTDLRIELVTKSDPEAWARIQRAAWGMPAAMTAWFTAAVGREGWLHYLGFVGSTPVAAAAMYVSNGVGWLGFGATAPSYRHLGHHSGLISRRIRDAADLGCSMLVSETGEDSPRTPNPTFHNLVRHGFQLAYHKQDYTPGPDGEHRLRRDRDARPGS